MVVDLEHRLYVVCVMDDGWMVSVDALPLCAYPPDTLFLPFEMGALARLDFGIYVLRVTER